MWVPLAEGSQQLLEELDEGTIRGSTYITTVACRNRLGRVHVWVAIQEDASKGDVGGGPDHWHGTLRCLVPSSADRKREHLCGEDEG